jgi:hypothetical protein
MHYLHPSHEAGWAWPLPPLALLCIIVAGVVGVLT